MFKLLLAFLVVFGLLGCQEDTADRPRLGAINVNTTGGSAPPSGAAGGALSGTYPNPGPASTVTWGAGQTSPTLTQAPPTSDTPTQNMVLSPQGAYDASVTNIYSGDLVVNLTPPNYDASAGGQMPAFVVQTGGVNTLQVQQRLSASGPETSYVYLGPVDAGVFPQQAALNGNATTTSVNAPSVNSDAGVLFLQVASANIAEATSGEFVVVQPLGGLSGTNALAFSTVSVGLTSGSNINLTSAQYYAPHIKFTGTLSGSGTSVTFPTTDGACWYLDFTGVTFSSNTVALKANSATWGTSISSTVSTQFPHVCYSSGAARLVGVGMTE